jgi:hypothetical protein
MTGNLQTYVESYYKTSANSASILLPTIYFWNALLLFFLGKYTSRNVQPKLLIALGGLMGCSSFLIAINMTNYWAFWFFYCFGWGLTTGWCYLVTFQHTWLWFPDHPGLASGICMGGYGVGSLVFNNIMTPIMNPGNESFIYPCSEGANYGCYPKDVNENFKFMMYVLISVFLGLVCVGILTVW